MINFRIFNPSSKKRKIGEKRHRRVCSLSGLQKIEGRRENFRERGYKKRNKGKCIDVSLKELKSYYYDGKNFFMRLFLF